MKQGKSIVEMAQELERIREQSKDYVSPVERLEMQVSPTAGESGGVVLKVADGNGGKVLTPNEWAHRQIASFTDVPQQYYQRIAKENPALLADNVNHGLEKVRQVNAEQEKSESRMLRTVGGKLRAFVSSKYRRLDSYDLMETVMPELVKNQFEVVSAEMTEMRFYMKAVTPRLQLDVKKGDTVQYGLVISSSDVGAGSVRIEPLIYRLVCLNGLILPQAIRKTHLGKDLADSDFYELLTDKTRDLTDAAFWAQVRDVLKASMDPKRFEREVQMLEAASRDNIKNFNIPEVVELASRAIGVSGTKHSESVVAYLANGADGAGLTRWGLINAFTFAAQQKDVAYDESVDMERAASKLIELPSKQWARISEKH